MRYKIRLPCAGKQNMPLIILILLLMLPLLDIYFILSWLFESTAVAATYMAITMTLGALMIKFAKIGVHEAFNMLRQGRAAIGAVAGFIKIWLAGVLLLFPGYLSDIVALIIFILPGRTFPPPPPPPPPPSADRQLEVEAEIVTADERDN